MVKKILNRIPRLYRTEEITLNNETYNIKGFRGMDHPILKLIGKLEQKARRFSIRLDRLTVLKDKEGNIVYDDVTIRNIDPEGNITERVVKQARKRPDGDITDEELEQMDSLMEEVEDVRSDVIELQETLAIRAILRSYEMKPSEIEKLESEYENKEEPIIELNEGEITGIYQLMQRLGEPESGFQDFQNQKKQN